MNNKQPIDMQVSASAKSHENDLSLTNQLNEILSQEYRLVVLFGKPGSGKSYVGNLMQQKYGYVFYDTDLNFTPEMLEVFKRGESPSIEVRKAFTDHVYNCLEAFLDRHPKVVLAYTLRHDSLRRQFLEQYPFAKFILVSVPEELRVARLLACPEHVVPKSVRLAVGDHFDAPTVPYVSLLNDAN